MKKISIVSAASFLFLAVASAVAILTRGFFKSAGSALTAGIVVLIVSGIVAFAAKERKAINIICFIISSISMGILLRAWYINRGFDNTLPVMCLISLAAVLYLWVFFALAKIPFIHKSKKMYTILCILYVIISAVIYSIVVAKTETTYVSTFGYYMIIELAFIFAMSLEVNSREELIRNLALSTYSVFIVAIIAAVFIIIAALGGDCDCDCDCGPDGCSDSCSDCGDCCDLCDCGDIRLKKNTKNK